MSARTKHVDYIVVGAGSAGCVLGERLSADPDAKVLVLEAGRANRNQLLRIPMTARNFWTNPNYLWNYASEPEASINGRRIPVPRGKLVGGSGALNGMLYARGHARDYDQWRQLGAEGWGYQDVLPYFKRIENDSHGEGVYHGSQGPLRISQTPNANRLTPLFIEAAKAAGIRHNGDQNGAESEGFGSVDGLIQATVHDSVSPGICTTGECDYTTEVEPDQDEGWCELCGKGTVQSALILAGLI